MESVSLFPKIHLELCDMQCKDDDLVIESSVTLKVSPSMELTKLSPKSPQPTFRPNTFRSDAIVIRPTVCEAIWLIYFQKILNGRKI